MTENKLLNKIKEGYGKYESAIKKFVYTDFYLILEAACVLERWVSKCAPLGITLAVVHHCF